jgi:hypothetical protein
LHTSEEHELIEDQVVEAKPRRTPFRWILAGAAVFVVAALVLVLTVFSGDDQQTALAGSPASGQVGQSQESSVDAPAEAASAQPTTVWLPGGGTAKLIHADVKDDGSLPIPQGLDEATWWGAKVGAAQGAVLLSGHVNWKGSKGPFDELWRLKAGQDVEVADTAGGRWVYRVDEVVTVHKDNLAAQSDKLFSQEGPHRLVLVTCGGEYVGGTEGYEDNRIATASLVSRP